MLGQFRSWASVPRHCTSSRRMGPVPWPKKAFEWAIEPVKDNYDNHCITWHLCKFKLALLDGWLISNYPACNAQGVKQYLLSVICLSVCRLQKIFKYPTSRYFFDLQLCHKLCKQSYLNIRVPHNTEHVAILCTFRCFLLSGAAGRPSWDTVYWIIGYVAGHF